MLAFPIRVPALQVEQPIGIYYVAILPARVLLQVCYSDVLSATVRPDGIGYDLDGTQRILNRKRLQTIADYINRTDSAFPNSIILAANFRREDGLIEDEDPDTETERAGATGRRWHIEDGPSGYTLTIPTKEKLAAIIDGQHRLFGFVDARPERLDMQLICSVFIDLPKPYQAQIFATINSTQKPVDKSLTYELFGYNIDEEEEQYWSPDKLAVYLTRKLGTDEKSPLRGKIVIAARKDDELTRLTSDSSWRISTSVIVEGLMRLFTSNPKKDTTHLLDTPRKTRDSLKTTRRDRSPLRTLYLDVQDSVIYTMALNFLRACEGIFWAKAKPDSFITRTVGIQALFDILRSLAEGAYVDRDLSVDYFTAKLSPAQHIDFSTDQFRNASGSGRTMIRREIAIAIGLD